MHRDPTSSVVMSKQNRSRVNEFPKYSSRNHSDEDFPDIKDNTDDKEPTRPHLPIAEMRESQEHDYETQGSPTMHPRRGGDDTLPLPIDKEDVMSSVM